jgi:hypothetical protein
VRAWLTPAPDPAFDIKCADICAIYHAAGTAALAGVRTVSLDEMTGIQALERSAPGLPLCPGAVERREFEYIRHGTQTLIAGFDVATGQVFGQIGDHRCETDFAAFLEGMLDGAAPDVQWEIVADNLNIHLSESVVRIVARRCGVSQDLGQKHKHPLPFYTQACLLAQPDRTLVLHPRPQGSAPRILHLGPGPQGQNQQLHRLLQ